MRSDLNDRGWARPRVGFLVISILVAVSAALTAAPQARHHRAGGAATIGQHAQGSSTLPDPQAGDGGGQPADKAAMQARQERELRRSRLEQLKEHASQLAEMAKSLQQEIDKSNANILSAGVNKKAQEIEKLAGKIRREAKY